MHKPVRSSMVPLFVLPFLAANCSGVDGEAVDDAASEHAQADGIVGTTQLAIGVNNKQIKVKQSGKCLDNDNGSLADTTWYQTWACDGGNNQRYHVWDQGGGKHDIRNVTSNKCLYVAHGANGAWVEQRTCNNADNAQLWYMNAKGNGEYEIRNVQYNKCMDLAGGGTGNGTKIQSYDCNNSAAQRFIIGGYVNDFSDGFDGTALNTANWQDQILWVNDEHQCYVPNGDYGTRSVGGGVLSLRLKNLGYDINCNNWDKYGNKHWNTRYVSSRIASKNRKESYQGKWTARLRLLSSGIASQFPAWWLLGYRNNEAPVQEANENVCWPLWGSGEVDIFEHSGAYGGSQFTARGVKSLGSCNNGDWSTHQVTGYATLTNWHEYAVEWVGNYLIYTVDNNYIGRNENIAMDYTENLFAILNYAKISGEDTLPAGSSWVMEVDWVKHDYWQQ
jgi:hypothetical protein